MHFSQSFSHKGKSINDNDSGGIWLESNGLEFTKTAYGTENLQTWDIIFFLWTLELQMFFMTYHCYCLLYLFFQRLGHLTDIWMNIISRIFTSFFRFCFAVKLTFPFPYSGIPKSGTTAVFLNSMPSIL